MIFLSANQRRYTPTLDCMFGSIPTAWINEQNQDIIFYGFPPYSVHIEMKAVGDDLVRSLLHGHLATQIAKARDAGFNTHYIATYGELSRDPTSGLARRKVYGDRGRAWYEPLNPNIQYSTLMRRLYTVLTKQSVGWIKGANLRDMCDQIAEWWWWWQAPPEMHKSDETPYAPVYLSGDIPLPIRVAKELPLIGPKRAVEVGERFGSVRQMVEATEADWATIPGIGKGIAKEIMNKPGWVVGINNHE